MRLSFCQETNGRRRLEIADCGSGRGAPAGNARGVRAARRAHRLKGPMGVNVSGVFGCGEENGSVKHSLRIPSPQIQPHPLKQYSHGGFHFVFRCLQLSASRKRCRAGITLASVTTQILPTRSNASAKDLRNDLPARTRCREPSLRKTIAATRSRPYSKQRQRLSERQSDNN